MIFHPDKNRPYQQPEAKSVYQILKTRAEKTPEAIVIIAPDRPPLTYGRLFSRIEKIVETLRACGLNRNDRCAIVLPNGPEMAVAFVALVAGATCAPLNPSYRLNEFDFYLSDLKAKALIIGADMDSPAREAAKRRNIPILELTPAMKAEAGMFEITGNKESLPTSDGFAQAEDVALVLHTSGTTSRPKIVPLTQTNICTSGHNIAVTLELRGNDRCLNVMPLFHIHGLIGAVISSLTAGASVVCTPGFDAMRFFEWLDTFRPTWYTAVPTMHQAILAGATTQREIVARCPMRFIRSCSASLSERLMADLETVFNAPVIESYGMTEASHQMTSNPLPPSSRKAGSVGVAAGPDVAIMDETGNLLSVGETGEVVIRGANVTEGYENNPVANQSALTNGWFRTGDQGRFDSGGYLFITGRIKEIINRGGEKIAPKEIDEILTQHPGIAQAVAFAMPHPTLGEDVAAAVVLHENVTLAESDIREFASARLADFKVPAQVLIVDEIPKGPTGKLQRIGLADKLASRLQKNYVPPRNPVEKELTEIWTDVLKVGKVGIRDNFYALGGDSLAMASMMILMENRYNKTVPLDSFLKSPTIESLSRYLQETESSGPDASELDKGSIASKQVKDSMWAGTKNRLLQVAALYAPGYRTTRVWLHRMRGVSIGNNVSIGLSALIETAYPKLVVIGNNVTIGMRAVIIGHLRDLTVQARAANQPTVRIEDNVYIGPGVIVLPNVTIGQGAVITAGSVVSRSIPAQTLALGNPARPIAHCGVSLGGGVSYEQFLRHLVPINDRKPF